MGYYTKYKFADGFDRSGVPEALAAINPAYFDYGEWSPEEVYDWKWYECEEDMRKLSRKFPDTFFCIEGQGDEGEHWRLYARNGRVRKVHAEVTFEPPTLAECGDL